MNTFTIFTYAAIVNKLNAAEPVEQWLLHSDEWQTLNALMPLQFEDKLIDGDMVAVVYAAAPHNGTVGFVKGIHTRDSVVDDEYFNSSRDHMFKQGRLQR